MSLSDITLKLSKAITFSEANCHERLAIKLSDPKTALKTYWLILQTFANGSKVQLIPSAQFVTVFLVKANLFNDYFRGQCRPITNDSFLPNNQNTETVTRLSDINIDTDTIIKQTYYSLILLYY